LSSGLLGFLGSAGGLLGGLLRSALSPGGRARGTGCLVDLHRAGLEQVLMPAERLGQHMRGVNALADRQRLLVVIPQLLAVVRMGTVLDDQLDALPRGQAAQIRQPLLGDDDHDIVLGVVDVANHRHDRGDVAALGQRRADEDRVAGVAGEVTRAADAVHHLGAHDVGRVDVAVDVGLDHAVGGDDELAADHLGVVRHVLRAQNDLAVVLLGMIVHVVGHGGRQ